MGVLLFSQTCLFKSVVEHITTYIHEQNFGRLLVFYLRKIVYFYFFALVALKSLDKYTIDVEALKSLDKYTIDVDKNSL